MIKSYLCGAGIAAALVGAASAAAAAPTADLQAWVITPGEDSCQTEIDLSGRSGATAAVILASDGDHLALKFAKPDLPERAFLPVRVDRKPYSNIIMRDPNAKLAVMTLSADTEAALRKGGQLQIGWLADEPLSASLEGSEHGIPDLRTCGAQVAGQWRAAQAAQKTAHAQADADARAKAVVDAQLQVAKAQAAAADAERQKVADEDARLRTEQAEADAERQRQAMAAQVAERQGEAAQGPYEQAQAGGYGYRRAYAPPPRSYGGYGERGYGQQGYGRQGYARSDDASSAYGQDGYDDQAAPPPQDDSSDPPPAYGYRSGW